MYINKYEQKIKQYIKISNRISEIYSLIYSQENEILDKPIFAGYWRFFTVRIDVLRSSIGQQVQLVVDCCNNWVLGRKGKDESSYNTSTIIYQNFLLKPYRINEQYLLHITEKELEKFNLPYYIINRWFHLYKDIRNFGSKNIILKEYYPQVPRYMLEFSYKRGYIKEILKCNSQLEKELTELKNFMNRENGWEKINGSYKACELDRISYKEKIERLEYFEQINEIR